jgi:hypothetical protein
VEAGDWAFVEAGDWAFVEAGGWPFVEAGRGQTLVVGGSMRPDSVASVVLGPGTAVVAT